MIVTHEENAVGLVKTHDKCKPKGSVYFAAKMLARQQAW